jgi:hypothetical protein
MAKKRRRDSGEPEETYEFVPPEFDEKEFLLRELYGTKVLLIAMMLAVVTGIVSACIYSVGSGGLELLGLLLIVLAMAGFKQFLVLIGFKAELVDQKMLISNYAMYFFLSLGVWIICINPPFV